MNIPFSLYSYFKISIIEDSIDNCLTNFCDLLKRGKIEVVESELVDFLAVREMDFQENSPKEIRFLIYEPILRPGITVFFTNLRDGWYTAIYNYTRLYHKSAYQLGFTVNDKIPDPAYSFNYFKSKDNKVFERVVYLIKENDWKFHEEGSPLEIEDVNNYTMSRKIERINNKIIIDYMKRADHDLLHKDFFLTNKKGYLIKYY